jgi:peptidoglycan/xylan/chitin deacetylase (PgdA/CDA1 family)
MTLASGLRAFAAVGAALFFGACTAVKTSSSPSLPPPTVFESKDFIVTFARKGDTAERLAARFLGDPAKAWMIEDYNGISRLRSGREVVIPKKPWSPSGVSVNGYQLVPVLVYHNIAPQARSRLVTAAGMFKQQMRYLKSHGYRVVRLDHLVEYTALRRQLPLKSVVLTFDDGYKSFLEYAYPILKEFGFPATLFVYTDYVGSGTNALDWADLKRLADEGFGIGAHSKSHSDLRRKPDEPPEEYARRMQRELAEPVALFQRHIGRTPHVLAYPYGAHDETVVKKVREYGYIAAFSVRREGNAAFVPPLQIRRSQIYSDMTLDEFARSLDVFHQEALDRETLP